MQRFDKERIATLLLEAGEGAWSRVGGGDVVFISADHPANSNFAPNVVVMNVDETQAEFTIPSTMVELGRTAEHSGRLRGRQVVIEMSTTPAVTSEIILLATDEGLVQITASAAGGDLVLLNRLLTSVLPTLESGESNV